MSASNSTAFSSGDLESLFHAALALETGARAGFLDSVRARNPEEAARLIALLDADERNRDGVIDSVATQNISEQIPWRIGNYRVSGVIGEGSVGAVFQARQSSTGRICAVKLLRPGLETATWRRRFQREAEFLGRLNHVGIAQVYDAGLATVEYNDGTQATRFYLAMEFVPGVNAAQYVRRRNPPMKERVGLVERASRAVHHAHEAGLIHRDLKPDNIMVSDSGAVKVVDFGIGRLLENDSAASMTGLLIGTPGFVSPEQLSGMRERVDTRTDVYALGATVYALLAGAPPNASDPTPLRALVPEADRRLEAIVHKALATKSEDRYPSAAQFAEDLRRWAIGEPISARPAPFDGLRRWRKRNPAKAWTIQVVLLLSFLSYLAITIQPEWKYQLRATLLPAPKLPVEVLGFDSAALPPDLAPLAARLESLFHADIVAGELFVPHSRQPSAGRDHIPRGAVDLLSADQIAAFHSAGIRTVMTGDFDIPGNQPWAPVEIRVRLIDTTDGRTVWTGVAKGSKAEIPALVAQLCRTMQETMGGREYTIRRQRAAPVEATRLAREGLDLWLRFDLVKARIVLEQAANLNVASAPIRISLARALYDLGYRDLARSEAAAAFRLATKSEDRREAETLGQELAANWPRAIELRQVAPANGPPELLLLASDLISAKRFDAAQDLVSREIARSTPHTGQNRWLLTRDRLLREVPGRHGLAADSLSLVETARKAGPWLFLAEALDKRSEALTFGGEAESSLAATEESRQIFAQEGHREGMIREMAILGQRLQVTGSTAQAIRILEQAMRAVEGAGFDGTEHYVANTLGQAYGRGYDLDLSRQMLTRAMALSWKSRDSDQSRMDRSRLGMAYRDLGQLDESRRLLRESLPPIAESPENAARVLNALGETELLAGNGRAALDAAAQAQKLAIIARSQDVLADSLTVEARALLLLGDPSKVNPDFALAVDIARKRSMWGSLAFTEMQWGEALLIEGNAAAAQTHLEQSTAQFKRIDRPAYLAQAQALLAIALERTHHLPEAEREAEAAHAIAKGTGFALTRVLVDYALAGLYAARGQKTQADDVSRAAIREAKTFGFVPLADRIEAQFPGSGIKAAEPK